MPSEKILLGVPFYGRLGATVTKSYDDLRKDYINKNLIIAIFNMNITLTKDLFKIIFDKISNELKLALLVRHLDLFNAEELKNLFAKMDGEYKELSNREKRHNIYLPINDENKRLGDYLYKIGYISNEDRYAKNKEENQLYKGYL